MKKAKIYQKQITEYEVVKETKCTIEYIDSFNKQKTDHKVTSYYSWHNSVSDALSYLIAKCNNEINLYKAQIEAKQQEIIELKNKYGK